MPTSDGEDDEEEEEEHDDFFFQSIPEGSWEQHYIGILHKHIGRSSSEARNKEPELKPNIRVRGPEWE